MPTGGGDHLRDRRPTPDVPSPGEAVFLNNTFYNNGDRRSTPSAPASDGINSSRTSPSWRWTTSSPTSPGNAVQADGPGLRRATLQYNLFYQNGGPTSSGVAQRPADHRRPGVPRPRERQLLPPADLGGHRRGPERARAVDLRRHALPGRHDRPDQPQRDPDPQRRPRLGRRPQPAGRRRQPLRRPGLRRPAPTTSTSSPCPASRSPSGASPTSGSRSCQAPGSATPGTGVNPATFVYVPITGERDQAGNLRVKDPNSPNVGFGSRPFFDLGAFEYIIQNPPVVTGRRTPSPPTGDRRPTSTPPAGSPAPTRPRSSIQVSFNEQLDPNTINGMSVILQASGGDGIFGNGNSPADRFINLSGLLSFDPITDILTINTVGHPRQPGHPQRRVPADPQGDRLVGDPRPQRPGPRRLHQATTPCPSPRAPTTSPAATSSSPSRSTPTRPSIVAGTFSLDPASDTSGGRNITKHQPADLHRDDHRRLPAGQRRRRARRSTSTSRRKGDGVFDLLDAGVGHHRRQRQLLGHPDQADPRHPQHGRARRHPGRRRGDLHHGPGPGHRPGRQRLEPVTDPLSTYPGRGRRRPSSRSTPSSRRSPAFSPLANTVATVNANGQVIVTVTFNKNIKTSTLNANSIQVFRTGGHRELQRQPDRRPDRRRQLHRHLPRATPPAPSRSPSPSQGPLPNDQYEIILKGTGANADHRHRRQPAQRGVHRDLPDRRRATTGSDFVNVPFTVYQPSQAHLIYVQAPTVAGACGTGTLGTRATRSRPSPRPWPRP